MQVKKRYDRVMIRTTNDLKDFCKKVLSYPFVALDTEFIREHSYYPQLCLIQIATSDFAECIDPMAEGLDLKPFFKLLQNKKIIKVFHSARQDIEIFYQLTHKIPRPLMDTQIMAMACGFKESISYQTLTEKIVHTLISKGQRATDWTKRPLTKEQVSYALADVTYLTTIYATLSEQLKQTKRLRWIADEMKILTDPKTYICHPKEAYLKAKESLQKTANPNVLQALWQWREEQAQEQNKPRAHILKDEILTDLVLAHPTTPADFQNLRDLPKKILQEAVMEQLIFLIQKALSKKVKKQKKGLSPLTGAEKQTITFMKIILDTVAQQQAVAPILIASTSDLAEILRKNKKAKPLCGWRKKVFGELCLDFLAGKISLHFNPTTQQMDFEKTS